MARVYPYKGMETKSISFLVDGPHFAAQLRALDLKLGRIVARAAIKAAGEVIAEKWREKAAALNTSGRAEGHYAASIGVRTRSQTMDDGGGGRMLRGANVVIAPYLPVGGVEDDEHPGRYAGVLEWGGHLGPKQGNAYIPAQPTARPALEEAGPDAVDAVAMHLRRVFP